MKVCPVCKVEFPRSELHKQSLRCIPCHREVKKLQKRVSRRRMAELTGRDFLLGTYMIRMFGCLTSLIKIQKDLCILSYIGVSLVGSGQKANGKIRLKVIMLAYTIVFADLLDSVLLNGTHKDTVLI